MRTSVGYLVLASALLVVSPAIIAAPADDRRAVIEFEDPESGRTAGQGEPVPTEVSSKPSPIPGLIAATLLVLGLGAGLTWVTRRERSAAGNRWNGG